MLHVFNILIQSNRPHVFFLQKFVNLPFEDVLFLIQTDFYTAKLVKVVFLEMAGVQVVCSFLQGLCGVA